MSKYQTLNEVTDEDAFHNFSNLKNEMINYFINKFNKILLEKPG